jgi:gliding motility-associated-like protein
MSKKIYILLYFICLSLFSKGQLAVVDTVCLAARHQVYSVEATAGSRYFWFVDGGTIARNNGNSVVVDWKPRPGLYLIKVVEINKYGCLGDTVSAQVIISGRMAMLISGPTDICRGEAAMLTASGAAQYLWNTGQRTASIIVKPEQNTTYTVSGYDGKCYTDTLHITVHVHDKPHADFAYSPAKPIINEEISFFAKTFGSSNYKWYFEEDPDNVTTSPDSNTTHAFHKGGHKTVTLVVTNRAGCTDTMKYTIYIDDEINIFVPSVFTPNGDGLNDTFKVICNSVQSFNLQVFNRWGEEIFMSDDINKGWDGTFLGQKVQQDVYYWQLQLQGGNNRWYYMNGSITVYN